MEKAKELEVVGVEVVTKKKQKVSISYTLKATSENIKKLIDNKIISKEDGELMKAVHKKAVEYWIGITMGL